MGLGNTSALWAGSERSYNCWSYLHVEESLEKIASGISRDAALFHAARSIVRIRGNQTYPLGTSTEIQSFRIPLRLGVKSTQGVRPKFFR